MASFDFVVDTSPMANTMSGVSGRVTETMVAVTAMKAAVIAEERAAANTLCENIDNGFYSLIQSQLSTKRTEHLSNLRAKFLTLRELGRALTEKQERMEADVARLHREYYKFFNHIDRSLEKQIRDLDQDACRFVDGRKNLIMGRHLKDVSEVVLYEKDESGVARSAVTAKVKKHAGKVLETMAENVSQNEGYQGQMASLLQPADTDKPVQEYIPVVYSQASSMVMQDSQVTDMLLPQDLDRSTEESVRQAVTGNLGRLMACTADTQEKARIAYEFREMAGKSNLDARVVQVMLYLFENGARR